MDARVGLKKRVGVDVLEDRAIARPQTRQRIAQKILLPVADGTDAVDEHEAAHTASISFSGQHGEATAPRVTQHVPGAKTKRFANRGQVASVVLDASRTRTWRCLRRATTPLVVEDELTALGQGSESGPQQVMIEQQSAVHTHERYRAVYLRREVYGELEPACANGAPY